eukprot:767936-Hanusia_phi.AAC.6
MQGASSGCRFFCRSKSCFPLAASSPGACGRIGSHVLFLVQTASLTSCHSYSCIPSSSPARKTVRPSPFAQRLPLRAVARSCAPFPRVIPSPQHDVDVGGTSMAPTESRPPAIVLSCKVSALEASAGVRTARVDHVDVMQQTMRRACDRVPSFGAIAGALQASLHLAIARPLGRRVRIQNQDRRKSQDHEQSVAAPRHAITYSSPSDVQHTKLHPSFSFWRHRKQIARNASLECSVTLSC